MVSTERFVVASALAAVPTAIAILLSPADVYAWFIVGLAVFLATFPAGYLLAGIQ
ncbi:hypothetical protein SAMN04488065_1928 [Haloplanus vescus]|uniref:Uncharacterized protein n=1 Tax=Haloplanus vescus TaxID=555874 RepID=A0A1H3YJT8_9EURY|nr:hypothetical protein [Haloplanus vescus]SEA11747.1 hypothetical protein SAMN04488065_1928 [Haloplanus vescus]